MTSVQNAEQVWWADRAAFSDDAPLSTAEHPEQLFFCGRVAALLRFSPHFVYFVIEAAGPTGGGGATKASESEGLAGVGCGERQPVVACDVVVRASGGVSEAAIQDFCAEVGVGDLVLAVGRLYVERFAGSTADALELRQYKRLTDLNVVRTPEEYQRHAAGITTLASGEEDNVIESKPQEALPIATTGGAGHTPALPGCETSAASKPATQRARRTNHNRHQVFATAIVERLHVRTAFDRILQQCVKQVDATNSDDGSAPTIVDVAGGSGGLAFALACAHGMPVTIVDPRPARFTSHKKWAQSLEYKWRNVEMIDSSFAACRASLSKSVEGAPSRPELSVFGQLLRKKFDVELPAQLNTALVDIGAPVSELQRVHRSVARSGANSSTAPDTQKRLRLQIQAFYRKHVPEAQAKGQRALLNHAGKEDTLICRLIEKYGGIAWDHFEPKEVKDDAETEQNSSPKPEGLDSESFSALHSVLHASLAIVGLHADQAADQIAFHGFLYQKPWAVVPCCVFPSLFTWRRKLSWETARTQCDVNSFEAVGTLLHSLSIEKSASVRSYEDLCEYFQGFGLLLGFHRFLQRVDPTQWQGLPMDRVTRDSIWKQAVCGAIQSASLGFSGRCVGFFWTPRSHDGNSSDDDDASESSSTPIADFEVERAEEELAVPYEEFVKPSRKFQVGTANGPELVCIKQSFLHNDMSFDGTGGAVWPVSERFVELLPTNKSLRDVVDGAVCVTLGCGVGLLDIALAMNRARLVFATDGDKNVVDIARSNGTLNSEAIRKARLGMVDRTFPLTDLEAGCLQYSVLQWGVGDHTSSLNHMIKLAVDGQPASARRSTLICVDVIYHRPAYPVLFESALSILSGMLLARNEPGLTVNRPNAAQTWAWSGTESDTESGDDAEVPANEGHESVKRALAQVPDGQGSAVSLVIGWHKRDEDKEAIILHMCFHCPALRLRHKVDIGALYTLRVYSVVPGAVSPSAVDLYRAACLACLD